LSSNRGIIAFNKDQLSIIKAFLCFNFYSIAVTILASFFLLDQEIINSDSYRGPEMNSLKEIIRAFFTVLSFMVVMALVKTFNDLRIFIKVLYSSILITIIYGYMQIYSIVFCGLDVKSCNGSLIQMVLEFLSPFIDQGWQNEKRMTPYPNSYLRLNLITPEASTAASLLIIYILPILLSSILSGFSFVKNKFYGFSFETIMFCLLIPILLLTFSSAAFYTLFILFVAFYLLSFIKTKTYIFRATTSLSFITLTFICFILYYFDLFDYVTYFVFKIFDLSVGSTNTRLAIFIASVNLFSDFPFGVGMGNHETMLVNYLPYWSLGNYEILKGITVDNLPTLNFWLNILTGNGIIGFILFLLFLSSIWKKIYTKLSYDLSGFSQFKSLSFIFFLIAFTFMSLTSSHGTFLWLWSIFGFYAALATIKLE
jgi:O-antigen ligase